MIFSGFLAPRERGSHSPSRSVGVFGAERLVRSMSWGWMRSGRGEAGASGRALLRRLICSAVALFLVFSSACATKSFGVGGPLAITRAKVAATFGNGAPFDEVKLVFGDPAYLIEFENGARVAVWKDDDLNSIWARFEPDGDLDAYEFSL